MNDTFRFILAHCNDLASIPRGYGSGDTSLVGFRASDELSTGTYMQYGFAQRRYELLSERNFYDVCFPLHGLSYIDVDP